MKLINWVRLSITLMLSVVLLTVAVALLYPQAPLLTTLLMAFVVVVIASFVGKIIIESFRGFR